MPFEAGNKWGEKKKGYKAPHTLETARAKQYIVRRVIKKLKPILDIAIEQAIQGDKAAREYLLNRVFGTPVQSIDIDNPAETKVFQQLANQINKMIENARK